MLLMLATTVISIGIFSAGLAAESLQNLYQTPAPPPKGVTIFNAEEIVTMSPTIKSATAVAVRDGLIIDVGNKEDLLERLKDSKGLKVDETLVEKVITPGLIDPHLHFWLFALVSNAHFITPADWDEGHVWENGLYLVVEELFSVIGTPEKFELGLERAREYIHAGGITAASDPGVQLPESMIRQMVHVLESGPMPFDYYLIPAGNALYDKNGKDADKAVAAARALVKITNGDHVKWVPDQIKLFTDGAVFSQLMQMKDGYLDGHDGEWIQAPEDFADSAWAFWKEGYQLIVHQNGDMGLELCLNTLEGLLHRYPRYDHRFGIHHFAFSAKELVARLAKLGAEVSSNPFYVHILGEQYSKIGVGPERAEVMARGRTVINEGVRLSFHSDAPMAPTRPMLLAWAAVNRIGLSGKKVLGPQEKVTPEEAFRAITIDAAHAMRKENEIGSIEIGKKANFAVFEENPIKANPKKLKDLAIWGTVFEGQAYPIKNTAKGMVMSPKDQIRMAM